MKIIFRIGETPGLDPLLKRIETEITAAGGKRSRRRSEVMELFFRAGSHLSVEELAAEARRRGHGAGTATVYRTLKLLARLGYAKEVDFGEGITRYESTLSPHHDHLVCTRCGGVAEFEDPGIERLQAKAAERHGFRPTGHRLEIYGVCRRCLPELPEGNGG